MPSTVFCCSGCVVIRRSLCISWENHVRTKINIDILNEKSYQFDRNWVRLVFHTIADPTGQRERTEQPVFKTSGACFCKKCETDRIWGAFCGKGSLAAADVGKLVIGGSRIFLGCLVSSVVSNANRTIKFRISQQLTKSAGYTRWGEHHSRIPRLKYYFYCRKHSINVPATRKVW